MPYITQGSRKFYKKDAEKLAQKLWDQGMDEMPFVGEVNYVISKIIWELFDKHPCYTLGNNLIGVLESVKQEFYRRKLVPYEEKKQQENGDI